MDLSVLQCSFPVTLKGRKLCDTPKNHRSSSSSADPRFSAAYSADSTKKDKRACICINYNGASNVATNYRAREPE